MKKRLFMVVCIVILVVFWVFFLVNKNQVSLNAPSGNQESKNDTGLTGYSNLGDESQKKPFSPTSLPRQPIVESSSLVLESEPNLSKAVQTIINGSDNNADYNDYRGAMLQLTSNLSDDDVSALMEFLKQKAADHSDMRAIAFNGVKNDVLDVLLRQNVLPKGIGLQLVDMYNDKSFDSMWRDYCIQFMSNYYERRWIYTDSFQAVGEKIDDKDADSKVIEAVLWDALGETDTTIAGTALLGLNSLSQQSSDIDQGRVGQVAVDLLSNSEIGEPTRITAFSIAASLGNQQALPEARIIAQTGETTTLRMAAIAAIGRLGGGSDLELLASLEHDDDERIRRIAKSALEMANSRIPPQSVQKK